MCAGHDISRRNSNRSAARERSRAVLRRVRAGLVGPGDAAVQRVSPLPAGDSSSLRGGRAWGVHWLAIVRITAYGERLGTGHTEPFYCDVAAVGKVNGGGNPLVVANEFICSRLAMHLGLPVPAGGIVTDVDPDIAEDRLAYVSLNFYPEGERPPPADLTALGDQHQPEIAGITVFDTWIVCGDRHARNIVFEPDLGVPLTFIDFDLSLCANLGPNRLGRLPEMIGAGMERLPNTLHELVTDGQHLLAWLERVVSLPGHTIDEIVREALEVGAMEQETAEATAYILRERRTRLRSIMKEAHEMGRALPNMTSWPLI